MATQDITRCQSPKKILTRLHLDALVLLVHSSTARTLLFFEPMKGLSQNLDLDMQARDSLLPDIDTLKPFHSTCRLKDVDYMLAMRLQRRVQP